MRLLKFMLLLVNETTFSLYVIISMFQLNDDKRNVILCSPAHFVSVKWVLDTFVVGGSLVIIQLVGNIKVSSEWTDKCPFFLSSLQIWDEETASQQGYNCIQGHRTGCCQSWEQGWTSWCPLQCCLYYPGTPLTSYWEAIITEMHFWVYVSSGKGIIHIYTGNTRCHLNARE